jgi:hypothetical protein
MDVQAIAQVLRGRGWEVEVKKRDEVADLVEVSPEGLWKCVDGRLSDKAGMAMRGPKVLGGVYGLVVGRGGTTLGDVKQATADIAATGFVPAVHGDHHAHEMGCGFFKLWKTGQFENVAAPDFSAEEGRAAVEAVGGVYESLPGDHAEEMVMINFVEGTTLEPNEKRFIVDAWAPIKMGLDAGAYLTGAAQTVEMLNGKKKAVLITE